MYDKWYDISRMTCGLTVVREMGELIRKEFRFSMPQIDFKANVSNFNTKIIISYNVAI